MELTKEQIAAVKGKGFLRNRGTDNFSGRLVSKGGVYSASDLRTVSEIAERFGSGKVGFTSRLSAEIVGIPYENIDAAIAYASERGLAFGGTGAKIRPVTACKGTTCVYGNFDTQALAAKIHDNYYVGWAGVKLPHKFKIGVGGCPNSCMKPSLNDFGIEGHRVPVFDAEKCRACKICAVESACPSRAIKRDAEGKVQINDACRSCGVCSGKCPFGAFSENTEVKYKIFVGGTWGKVTRMGTALSRLVSEDEVFPILEKVMLWYKENAYEKERLGAAVDRLGKEKLEADIFCDAILSRKAEIISAPIKTR